MSKGSSGMRIIVGAAGDARPRGDVAGVAAHDLDDHHPVVRLGGGVQPVDGLGGDLHRGVEAEGELGARQVVVDGLRHADDLHAELVELVGHAEGVLAADGDEGVDAEVARGWPCTASTPPSILNGLVRDEPSIVPPRGSDAPHGLDVERPGVAVDDAPPAVEEADELVAVGALALADDRPHHGVEAGAVTAAGQHRDAHRAPRRWRRWHARP